MEKIKPRFSIRYKFLSVTTALLITCVGAYLFLATSEFKSDKRSLVFDFNQSIVWNISSDLESFFASLSDKTRMVAFLFRESEEKRKNLLADFLRDQNDLVFIAGSESFHNIDTTFFTDTEYLNTYKLNDDFFDKKINAEKPIPFQKIQTEGQAIWNASLKEGPPLIGIGRSVIEENQTGVPIRQFAVVAYVRADRIIKSLEQGRPNEVYILLDNGDMLVHPDYQLMTNASPHSDSFYDLAKASPAKRQIGEFKDKSQTYLGAFAKALNGRLIVMSKVSDQTAFQAVNNLILRSLIFASTIVTLAFLAAIFFSQSLTRPLDILMRGMGKVSEGDLSSQIDVHSKDEIAMLANSFNRMITELKQSREDLENINRDLEKKVQARTAELEMQNRLVKEAQEALLRTTRLAAIGEVAGQAVHEVLNPMTSIISRLNKVRTRVQGDRAQESQVLLDINKAWEKDYADGGFQKLFKVWSEPSKLKSGSLLWDEDIDNLKTVGNNIVEEFRNLKEDTEFLIDESERIVRIINSFRSLSTSKGAPTRASIHELCVKSIKIMADLAARDQNIIETKFHAIHDIALVDEDEFIQVMTNLIRNALQSMTAKHKDGGSGRLVVSSIINQEKLEIHIEDNGLGISPEFQNKLFEKNFTTKSKTDGMGIGLSISRRLIRAFHGDITIGKEPLSRLNGAHFVITLPLVNEDTDKRGVA